MSAFAPHVYIYQKPILQRVGLFAFFVVNVDEWLNQAHMDSLTAEENGMARTSSQISLHTESSGGVCVFHSGVCE